MLFNSYKSQNFMAKIDERHLIYFKANLRAYCLGNLLL